MKRIMILILALVMLLSCAAYADEGKITVSGSAAVNLGADCVSAVLGINMSGSDLTALQNQVNTNMEAVFAALVSAGLDENNISTNAIYINPDYYGSGDGRGYTIDNSLTIQTDEIDKLGAYIDAAFAAGANTLNSINFSAKDDRAARKQALENAVQDARDKAEIIAAASGHTLGEIEEIIESGVYSYARSSYDGWNYAAAETAAAGTSVRAAQILVNANIQITYELK